MTSLIENRKNARGVDNCMTQQLNSNNSASIPNKGVNITSYYLATLTIITYLRSLTDKQFSSKFT